ncbi:hypothetical protein KSF_106170 [Reticulibacter mediterranei]|uniref:Uncharacterized protein n=1 Tax=Reticulibacter mediterranei TaxID=2778369 RepID=A0A8J3N6W9_9CHLR|nr:hypothetical protein [Reticulibacter mediterranei]GHP00570.1 hypothetical protein KSF_106170 [Reticulibacter mediterranei]
MGVPHTTHDWVAFHMYGPEYGKQLLITLQISKRQALPTLSPLSVVSIISS